MIKTANLHDVWVLETYRKELVIGTIVSIYPRVQVAWCGHGFQYEFNYWPKYYPDTIGRILPHSYKHLIWRGHEPIEIIIE